MSTYGAAYVRNLQAERDALLEAVKVAKAAMDADSDAVANVYEIVTEAIAKAEGRSE